MLLDPQVESRDIPIQVAGVDCKKASSVSDCTSGGWGRGQGDFQGCKYEDVLWLSCEK